MTFGSIWCALVFAIGIALTGCGNEGQADSTVAVSSQAQSSGDPAADLVRNFKMGSNLEQMANAMAASTHTYASVSPTEVSA